jgi:hypothetical protein
MIISEKKIFILFVLFYLTGAGLLRAEESFKKNEAPQILTSDLVRKQVVRQPSLVVSFIIVDDDKIETVMINGVSQRFKVGDTIVISKKFIFKPGKTLVEVVAIDEKGNRREKKFLVGYRSECGDNGGSAAKTNQSGNTPWQFKGQVKLAIESDSNPTGNLSSPIKIGDIKLKGDKGQPDNRNSISALVVASRGKLNFFEGYVRSEYNKKANFDLKSQVLFAGAGYSFPISKSLSIPLRLILMDVNLGGRNFSQNMAFEAGSLFNSEDSEVFYQHFLGVDLVSMGYAEKSKSSGYRSQIKWDYNSLTKDKQNGFHFLMTYGQGSSGTKESINKYLSFDLDWMNRLTDVVKWDLGVGLAKLNYDNEPPLSEKTQFGKTRVDVPIRISSGLGWVFTPDWELQYDYKYFFNMSNKIPYIRIVNGLSLKGMF